MRIIQDSEDEEDFELGEGPAAKQPKDASAELNHHSPQPADSGMSSTDSLKRTIEEAHQAHFQAISGRSSDSHPQNAPNSSMSLLNQSSKRRRTVQEYSPIKSSAGVPVRNGTPDIRRGSNSSRPCLEQENDTVANRVEISADKSWNHEGHMLEDLQRHEPMALFPEPSSTIPHATATQQLLGGVLAPAFLGLEPEDDVSGYEPPKDSVPWSDFLKSSFRVTEDRIDLTHSSRQSGMQPHTSTPQGTNDICTTLEPNEDTSPVSQSSQHLRPDSIVRLHGECTNNEIAIDGVNPQDIIASLVPKPNPHEEALLPHTASFLGSYKESLEPRSICKEHRQISHSSQQSQKEAGIALLAQDKQQSMLEQNSEDDLRIIGLAKEQYKPRPTRSRSLKITAGDRIDYSMRPEKAAKRPRRSRTSGDSASPSFSTTPEKVQRICDMGFTPSTTKRALRQNNGDVAKTVNWLVVHNAEMDELAPPRSSKSKRRRSAKLCATQERTEIQYKDAPTPERQDQTNAINRSTIADATTVTSVDHDTYDASNSEFLVVPSKSPNVKVLISKPQDDVAPAPSKSSQSGDVASLQRNLIEAPRMKPSRRKTSMDQPEPLLEPAPIVVVPSKEKRKRGRPRKVVQANESVTEDRCKDLHTKLRDRENILQEIPMNVYSALEPTALKEANETITNTEKPVAESVPLKDTPGAVPEVSMLTPEKPPKATNNVNTSIGKGKVSFRVGLSKRARIAPLLRTMKK